ncbi:C40 family peptidase [Mycobacterium sp. HUMS_1102779]|uniref:C40 family peptidase n=1 Tax=Mycobacterium sp. HUMS_1102779 TaxID=3383487 RepID=UPI00389A2D78
MIESELMVLDRAHRLFAGHPEAPAWDAGRPPHRGAARYPQAPNVGAGQRAYELAADRGRELRAAAAHTDAETGHVVAEAHRDRERAHALTKSVVDEARADAATPPRTPMAQREAMRRRAARLRAQRAHVLAARARSRRHAAALRALGYRLVHHRGPRGVGLSPNGRAARAVRAALSRLGRPYVWGAAGPDRFDCSGLVQWCYAQAGVHLDRTTYQQIHDGVPVPRSQVRPGDLVFPHAGHVQLAIGNDLVVEAPYPGASVRISRLGGNVQIRRPL